MIIGIDVGTQSLKVSVLDGALRTVGRAIRCYRPRYPRPGWVEQDPHLWTDALGPAIADALRSADLQPSDIRTIGLCGQLDGCIAVDANGNPLSPCLTWMDRRATSEIEDVPADVIRAQCGLVLDPSHLAPKARWLMRHLEGNAAIARFHQPVSFLVEQLTGVAVIDHALASTSMVYSLDRCRYESSLLDRFELIEAQLPPVARAEDRAGTLSEHGAALTGLPRDVRVAVGTGDDFATPLGGGLTAPGRIAVVLGTGEVVGGLHPDALRDDTGLLETHAYPGGAFFIENPGWFSGGSVTWLSDLLNVADLAALERDVADLPIGADGLTFIPALTGAMAPEWQPAARGCFYGLTPAHGKAHMFRALLEGCAFAMRDVVDRLDRMGVAGASLLLLGGGAQSALWSQMRADLARRPVELPDRLDTAPAGAALLAAVAGGMMPDLHRAAEALPIRRAELRPDPNRADEYEAAYRRYRRLFESLRPLFSDPAQKHARNARRNAT